MINYSLYSENDFIMDPDFQGWVKNPTPESEAFWSEFLVQHPHKRPEIYRAKDLLSSITFQNDLLPSEHAAIWRGVKEAMQKETGGKLVFMSPPKKRFGKSLFLAAALFFGLVLLGGFYYFKQNKSSQLVFTEYGEIKRITLPDSSIVTLNAHSAIRYDRAWNETKDREVWVEGEAFFSVRHTANNQRFVVHTNELDIEVLGTEFNVKQREKKLMISLNSGKIKLAVPEQSQPLYMEPGDILEVHSKNIKKISGKVEDLSVWRENRLVFDDTPLSEIVEQLKDIYGWEIGAVDKDLLQERLSGEIETRDENKMINTLEKALRINIDRKGNVITISRP